MDMIGTWDKVNKAFIVERAEYRAVTGKPNVRMSLRRLQKLYPECPGDMRGAVKYWHRYLESVLLGVTPEPVQPEPDPMELERLRVLKEVGPATVCGTMPGGWAGRLTKTKVRRRTIKDEVEAYLERRRVKYKNKKAVSTVAGYLNLFLEVTGEVPVEEVTRHHYEEFHGRVMSHKTWASKRSKANALQAVNSFLKHLESVHPNLRYGFRHAADFRVQGANVGQKRQWTVEQLKEAIKLSEGNRRVRFALLMAINAGAYWGDIMKPKGQYQGLKKSDIKGEYLAEVTREKNNTKDTVVLGTWWLWPETRKALVFGLTKYQLESAFTAFRVEHGLPLFLDIRKTVSQLIHDDVGETEARLWRCEELEGCIGKNYVKAFSEEQIADLRRALEYVREVLIEGKPRRDKWGNVRPSQQA